MSEPFHQSTNAKTAAHAELDQRIDDAHGEEKNRDREQQRPEHPPARQPANRRRQNSGSANHRPDEKRKRGPAEHLVLLVILQHERALPPEHERENSRARRPESRPRRQSAPRAKIAVDEPGGE